MIQSPLNYTGGKYKLLPQILPLFPKDIDVFVDLFCGGCNVGINVDCNRVIYNDLNENLLYLYNTFKNLDKESVLEWIYEIIEKYNLSLVSEHGYDYYGCESSKGLGNYNREGYLRLRADFNQKHANENFDYYYYVMLYVIIVYAIVPKHFFKSVAAKLYQDAFTSSKLLYEDCDMPEISECLIVNDDTIVAGINEELGINVSDMQSARAALEDTRYQRLQHLIDTKFTDDKMLSLLDCFETRNDDEIRSMVTDNADVPTIFEYVLGILWYKASERHGKILDYMKLSLDADLLPKTHAAGGEADIVYEYEATEYYPEHTLLLEATLADSTNQRRMEMEPVSRHLGMHLIRTGNMNSYCVFATNYLNINVISDFRSRKTTPFYDPQDYSKSVNGMKIIPLQTSELKKIISNSKTYKELYPIFEEAFNSTLPPHEWYNASINNLFDN